MKKQGDEDECEVCGSEDHTTDEHDSASKADDTSGGDKEAKKDDDTSGGDKEAAKSGDKSDEGDDSEPDDDDDDNKDTSKVAGEEGSGDKAGAYKAKDGEDDMCMSKGAPADADPKDYGYTPDLNDPSTWRLKIMDAGHVGGAAAALDTKGGGFRGQHVQIPDSARAKVKAKVRAAWRKHNPDKDPSEMPEVLKSNTTPEQLEAMLGNLSKRMESVLGQGV